MGKKIVHAGLQVVGKLLKFAIILFLGISMIAVCEGFSLGRKVRIRS